MPHDRSADDRESSNVPAAVPSITRFVPRGLVGGALMGLANLVPGISGGTMLLAAGVYPSFIDAIADLTTLRLRSRAIVVLGTIGGAAIAAIGLLAGPTRTLVIEQRPLMYSLFIGLTLGGLPLVWRMARPATHAVWVGAALAFAGMVAMAFGSAPGATAERSVLLLVLSGIAGASAMILPGISGGYLLLLLGQYEPILGAIDTLKQGLLASGGPDLDRIGAAMETVLPLGVGVAIGVVGVSNALRWLLRHHEKATLGVLLGLLVGAVVGLYPFQRPVPPSPGFVLDGERLAADVLASIPPEDWPLVRFTPEPSDWVLAAAAMAVGWLITFAIARLGRDVSRPESPEVPEEGNPLP